MSWLQGIGPSSVQPWLVVFEEDSGGEANSIMYLSRPLPRLTASLQGRNEDSTCREQGKIRRTQSTHGLSGTRGRKKASEKLTKAHSGSRSLRIAEDAPMAVCYRPKAFEGLPELASARGEGAA